MVSSPATNPKVSVCIPLYNGEAYLTECLASVSSQTFMDLEVILVDDASSDGSYEIAAGFARRDSRFRVYRNSTRLGLVGNWNHTIRLSRGTWIKLLFQDDLIEETCLAKLLECCESNKCGFGFCLRQVLFDSSVTQEARTYMAEQQAALQTAYKDRRCVDRDTFARICAERADLNLVGEPTVTLFHRSMVEKVGDFNPALIQMCDTEYWVRLGCSVGIAHVPEQLATFRVHGRSTTAYNHAERAYRVSLEPLLLTHVYLFDKRHKRMRRELYKHLGFVEVWLRFIREAYHARKAARLSLWGSTRGDRRVQQEWRDIVRLFPGLQTLAILGIFFVQFKRVSRVFGMGRPDIQSSAA